MIARRGVFSSLLACVPVALAVTAFMVLLQVALGSPTHIPANAAGWYTPALASSGVMTSPAQVSVYLPTVMRDWLDVGPHLPLAYGPYRPGQAPGAGSPSPAEIAQDMTLLESETRLIRSYASCDEWATVTALARDHNVRIYQGIALSGDAAANERQLACYQQLLEENQPYMAGAMVGNEVLLRGELTPAQVAGYVERVKQLGSIHASSGEPWHVWCALQNQAPRCPGLKVVAEKLDFITAHVHPYWEAVPIAHAAAHVIATQIFMRTTFTDTEVMIGEAGWPTCGSANGMAVPGVENQRTFIEDLWKWSRLYNIHVLFFEAFDEDWKAAVEGDVGRCWGMYYADRTAKHSDLAWPAPLPEVSPSATTVRIDHPPGNTMTLTKGNCGVPVFGRVFHAQPGWKVRVEVFTDRWYVQDKWYVNGEAPIVDGKWAMPEIVLAGTGQFNNHRVRATLVDETGNPVGNPVVRDEVVGIERTNSCTP
ncbi:MAG: hypothetical protein H3C34_10320 [Caldilineaceae bacterium]|nr:hypothetical protein [Caldilineaceae bacterium]